MDFAQNWTPRIRLHYSVHSRDHVLQVRAARGANLTEINSMLAKLAAFISAGAGMLYSDWLATSAEYALTDSDVFLPLTVPSISTGALSTSGRPASQRALGLTLIGRGANGSKWKMTLFGTGNLVAASQGDDWTLTTTESTPLADMIEAFTELPPIFRAIDGSTVTPYPKARLKYYDHWVKDARS